MQKETNAAHAAIAERALATQSTATSLSTAGAAAAVVAVKVIGNLISPFDNIIANNSNAAMHRTK